MHASLIKTRLINACNLNTHVASLTRKKSITEIIGRHKVNYISIILKISIAYILIQTCDI